MTLKRFGATALAALMILSVVSMAFAGTAVAEEEPIVLEGDDTDEILEFDADADTDLEHTIEPDGADFDEDGTETVYLNVSYDEYDHLEYDAAVEDADADYAAEFDASDLETVPGEPGETTTVEVTTWGEDADGEETTAADTFELDLVFSDERSVTFVHDDAVDDSDVGPDVESEERELGTLAALNPFADDPEHDAYEIDDDRTLTDNATHHTYYDGDVADAFEATAEDRDDGDAIYAMTQLSDDDVVIVFNEEMDSDWLDEDEDAYAVYDSSADSVTVYNLADSDETDLDLFGANDVVTDFVDTGDAVDAFDDEFGFMGMFSAFGATAAGMSLTGIGLSIGTLAGLFVVGRRRVAA